MELDEMLGIDPQDPDTVDAEHDVQAYIGLIRGLVAARRSCGLTQEDVAELMGTTQSAVSKLESVGGDARFSTIQRYARAVGSRLQVFHVVPGGRTVASVRYTAAPPAGGLYRRTAPA